MYSSYPSLTAHKHTQKKEETRITEWVNWSNAYASPSLCLDWQLNCSFALGLFFNRLTCTFAGTAPLSRSRKQKASICDFVRPSFASLWPSGRAIMGYFGRKLEEGRFFQIIYLHFPQFVCVHQPGRVSFGVHIHSCYDWGK